MVDRIQGMFEHLYDVTSPLRANDYLIDGELRRSLPGAQLQLPEQLFVRGASLLAQPTAKAAGGRDAGEQSRQGRDVHESDAGGDDASAGRGRDGLAGAAQEDVVEVALYLDADILALLAHDDPFTRLHRGNLEAFCVACEGIGHLLFLAWRLGHGMDVTALELELQAEIDKFCLCALLFAQQNSAGAPALSAPELWQQLFVAYELQPGLTADERHRYRTASRAAGRIARSMLPANCEAIRPEAVIRAARLWCRRSLADKMRMKMGRA